MQTLVLLSLFRKQSRERIMGWLEWCLPNTIPYVWRSERTPAQVLPMIPPLHFPFTVCVPSTGKFVRSQDVRERILYPLHFCFMQLIPSS